MTPRAFRALPRQDQIEMMAHRQEENLRESHAAHVQRMVAKNHEADGPGTPPGKPRKR